MDLQRPRAIDHLVLPTASLATARDRLTMLGFTVAPEGRHPFGTANCCVYLADGTFLEPLAVANPDEVEAAMLAGNVFVTRDAAYRRSVGREGFSALVMGTDDANPDHAAFVEAGLSAGNMLDFSRPFIDASGAADTASFRLAFAANRSAPNAFFFTCQRVNSPKVDRGALQVHANGTHGIVRVLACAGKPEAYAGIFSAIASAKPVEIDGGLEIQAANATVGVLTPANLLDEFGFETGSNGMRLVGLIFGVADLSETEAFMQGNGVRCERQERRLIVQPAPGQGALFAFEDTK